ncbi:MAG: hypothetical protein ACXQTW_07915 [Candidatus Methanospirareceae archaeon]
MKDKAALPVEVKGEVKVSGEAELLLFISEKHLNPLYLYTS